MTRGNDILKNDQQHTAVSDRKQWQMLLQPHFFCGQLLTDQDLNQLLDWTQEKFKLNRFRQGWGVVCGLEVRIHPEEAGHILVGPGYAVDNCGQDIIVSRDRSLDLRDICPKEQSRCFDFSTEGNGSTTQAPLFAIDVMINYKAQLTQPQMTIGRDVCREAAKCDYSRKEEAFTLSAQPVNSGTDSMTADANAWCKHYTCCTDLLAMYEKEFIGNLGVTGTAVSSWLMKRLVKRPLRQFAFVKNLISALSGDNQISPEAPEILNILFWLVQEYRNTFLSQYCPPCDAEVGIPLARVWLEKDAENECQICAIDAGVPFQRPFASEQNSAPPGQLNLGSIIWQRTDVAYANLVDLGFEIEWETITFTSFNDLKETLKIKCGPDETYCSLFQSPQKRLLVQVVDTKNMGSPCTLGQRVISFEESTRYLSMLNQQSQKINRTQASENLQGKKATAVEKIDKLDEQKSVPDDLTKVPQIGPVRAEQLQKKFNIFTYEPLLEKNEGWLEDNLELSFTDKRLYSDWRAEVEKLIAAKQSASQSG